MFNLIMKDIKTVFTKKTIIFYLVFMPILLFSLNGSNNFSTKQGVYVFVTILVLSGVLNTFSRDEKNKVEIMLNSLPINRYEFVVAKYLTVFAYIILIIPMAAVGMAITSALGVIKVSPLYIFDIISLFKIIGIILTFLSLAFPVYFKLGLTKGRNVVIFIYIILGGMMGALTSENIMIPLLIDKIFIIFSFVVFIISILISIKVYGNKDIG